MTKRKVIQVTTNATTNLPTWKQVVLEVAWKQAKFSWGLCPRHLTHHETLVSWYSIFLGNQDKTYNFQRRIILLSHDVELNPGPNIEFRSYNTRGLKEYNKLKRILNYFNKTASADIGVTFLQETHLTILETKKLEVMWRGDFVASPGGDPAARGCILLYHKAQFQDIIFSKVDPDGRSTILVASKNNARYLFCGIYGPNRRQTDFHKKLLNEIQDIIVEHRVDYITIGGDFNTELVHNPGKKLTKDQVEAAKIINNFLRTNNTKIVTDTCKHTWGNSRTKSTIDYIATDIPGQWTSATKWGVDKSDHALVESTCKIIKVRGPGMARIDIGFLENPEIREKFITFLNEVWNTRPEHWNPHEKLEFLKTCIRSEAFRAHSLLKKDQNTKVEDLRNQLQASIDLSLPASEIDQIKNELEDELDIHAKKLAQRARVQWIEKGERSNKYFMSLIKQNQKAQIIDSIINADGDFIHDQKDIEKEIHKFYQDLYSKQETAAPSSNFPDTTTVSEEENHALDAPLTLKEITETIRNSKGTTPGPDGIPNGLYKEIWDIAGPVILDAWNFSLDTGLLAESQRDAIICLLEKKGKDRRIINNLRPITLSNCDLKIITKTYTTRMNKILSRIISNNQTAYIPGRQVHDGLRLIDAYISHHSNTQQGYLIGLDAKKAYDSVSHDYIDYVLSIRGFSSNFRHVFRTLYNKIGTRIMVNGFLTDKVMIGRGVKQGDALSCSLFILVMDQIITDISRKIDKIKMNELELTNTIGYADDLAVAVNSKAEIQKVIETYEKFSLESGLYLNADKTEVLNMHCWVPEENVTVTAYGEVINIKMVDQVKICGKTFTLSSARAERIIEEQIQKVSKNIKMWEKRNLSTEGRILVSKTFGISQVVYNLQNTFFEPKHLKQIENIIYKFIWKGPDKIKREIIKKGFGSGGLKGPCIESLDATLKLKQVARCSISLHDIKLAQRTKPLGNSLHAHSKTKDKFTIKGISTFNTICCNIIKEIFENPWSQIRTEHFDLIAKTPPWILNRVRFGINMMKEALIKQECRVKNITNMKDALNCHQPGQNIMSIMNGISPSVTARVMGADTESQNFTKIPIRLNIFKPINKIKHRDLFSWRLDPDANNNLETVDQMRAVFMRIRNILHPKERYTQFMALHKKTYTNEKLHRLRIIDHDQCHVCPNVVEDRQHLYHDCVRAKSAWKIYSEITNDQVTQDLIDYGPEDKSKLNIFSLIKHNITCFRDQPINPGILKARAENRRHDLNIIQKIKLRNTKRLMEKKLNLYCE
jgi:hypothetical protein